MPIIYSNNIYFKKDKTSDLKMFLLNCIITISNKQS